LKILVNLIVDNNGLDYHLPLLLAAPALEKPRTEENEK
jgi:hypothetical protein